MRESLSKLAEFCRDNDLVGTVICGVRGNGDILVSAAATAAEGGGKRYKESAVVPLLHLANVREGFDLVGATEERLVAAVIAAVTEDNEKTGG
jgi:hypothetical protein